MILQGEVWHWDLLLSGWLLVGSAHAAIAAGTVGLAHDAPQGLSGGVAGQRVRDELERLGQLEAGQALACPGRQRSDEVAIPSVGGRSLGVLCEPHNRVDGFTEAVVRHTDDDRLRDRRVREQGVLDLSRSEEHTSELKSLMRNSYAVFCLTKKNKSE